jgi:hypothetical protein
LQRIEREGLIPGASYFEAFLSDDKAARAGWHGDCFAAFDSVDLAFFDPDNGLEVAARPRGRKHSNKYAFIDELAEHYAAGRSILLYQHYPRHKPRAEVTANACARLVAAMRGANTISLKSPFAAFLLATRPEHVGRVFASPRHSAKRAPCCRRPQSERNITRKPGYWRRPLLPRSRMARRSRPTKKIWLGASAQFDICKPTRIVASGRALSRRTMDDGSRERLLASHLNQGFSTQSARSARCRSHYGRQRPSSSRIQGRPKRLPSLWSGGALRISASAATLISAGA